MMVFVELFRALVSFSKREGLESRVVYSRARSRDSALDSSRDRKINGVRNNITRLGQNIGVAFAIG